MNEQERVLVACALVHKLEQLWRPRWSTTNGTFSEWYLLVASVALLGPQETVNIDGASDAYLAALRLRYQEGMEPGEKFISQDLAQVPYPAFLLVVLQAVITMVRASKSVTKRERELLAHAIVVLAPWRAKKKRGSKLDKMLQAPTYRFKEPATLHQLKKEALSRVTAQPDKKRVSAS